MGSIISINNVGKKYTLSHKKREQYLTMRDVIADTFIRFGNKIVHPFKKRETDNCTREEFWALKDVSFEIHEGDRIGIIGRNGAGKSTLLKILSRITKPSTGEVHMRGRAASLLEVGTGFHPELTGRENIYLNGAILGMTKAEIRGKFDEIVSFAEVEKFLDTPVKHYSSGMYVRLAFAVSAHLESEILLVDEVLAVGDAQFQKKCLTKMHNVSERGRTLLFVSHNMQAIRRLCMSAVLIENGTTTGLTSVEESIRSYYDYSKNVKSDFDVALESMPRASGLGDLVKLVNLRVTPDSSFCYGKPLKMIFTLHSTKNLPDVALGVGFDSVNGNRVMTLDSDNDRTPLNLASGLNDVLLSLDRNPLHPGIYAVTAAVLSRNCALDVVSNCITWEVMSEANDVVCDRGFGGCRLAVKTTKLS